MTDELETKIDQIIQAKFAHILEDISFRIDQAYDIVGRATGTPSFGKVYAEDLNLQDRHFITGYTVTPNSPIAGSIAWVDLHIVYNGADQLITNANTANKYAWWSPTTTPTVLQSSNTKPILAAGEVLLFVNNGGTPIVMLSDTNASLPKALADGAVDASAILANAVTQGAIATGAIGSAQIGANAVTTPAIATGAVVAAGLGANAVTAAAVANSAISRAAQFTGGVVDATALGANAVTAVKLADGAVVRSTQLTANVVDSAAIANNAVDTAAIQANAVTSSTLADNAVARTAQLATNVVTTAAIATGAVTDVELGTGAVIASKLSILRHVLY
jgi:hypothetical protein